MPKESGKEHTTGNLGPHILGIPLHSETIWIVPPQSTRPGGSLVRSTLRFKACPPRKQILLECPLSSQVLLLQPSPAPPLSPSFPNSLLLSSHSRPILARRFHHHPEGDASFNATGCTWLEMILENLAPEEAAERHGRNGANQSTPPGNTKSLSSRRKPVPFLMTNHVQVCSKPRP